MNCSTDPIFASTPLSPTLDQHQSAFILAAFVKGPLMCLIACVNKVRDAQGTPGVNPPDPPSS